MDQTEYDVLVVGGGHAGAEAALAAARLGASTALITTRIAAIANMPCNPAVGGIAKSHLVMELDALGGEIGRNTDYTGIQFRTLNTRKGPAVQATRVQCDKAAYAQRMQAVLAQQPDLEVIEARVAGLLFDSSTATGVVLDDNTALTGKAVVLTPGTSLHGVIHVGDKQKPGGGDGLIAADALGSALRDRGLRMARFKTGTPARLNKNSLNYDKMEIQEGLVPTPFFSWEVSASSGLFHVEQSGAIAQPLFHVEQSPPALVPWAPGSEQLPCYLTYTTQQTHDIIRDNLARSAMYGGGITGTGVRYCPSIEDKIVKFPDKACHHVFIEPEGRDSSLIYPNGISNSLPVDVQERLVHSIPGLEEAEIVRPAYAIEYDMVDSTQLTHALEVKHLPNLFLAGQINGTTGYEEAAAQGFVAGVNAARRAMGGEPFTLDRTQAYIGVLIDDLVTKGTDEPYRMFTSRSEYRLMLRQDNARYRLLDVAASLGILPDSTIHRVQQLKVMIEEELARLSATRSGELTLAHLLRRPETSYADLPGGRADLPPDVIRQVEISTLYEGYIARERRAIEKAAAYERQKIRPDFDYDTIGSLKREAKEKLSRVAPATLGQALRIPGISPADVAILSVMLKRPRG